MKARGEEKVNLEILIFKATFWEQESIIFDSDSLLSLL